MFLILFLVFTDLWAIEPTGYEHRPDLKAQSEIVGSNIVFRYGFKDLNGAYQEWSWQDDYAKLSNLGQKFGVPINDTNRALALGLFQKHPLVGVIPDYSKLISLYQGTVVEIYRHWKQATDAQKLTRRQSIELLLRFLQDYPYGIPPSKVGEKFIAGLMVPPLAFESGWADCDSKSLLLATILSFDPYFKDKMAMILVPGHALLGIEVPVLPYDETYEYRNRQFVVAEPTGLSRTPFGRKNSPYTNLLAIIPLEGPESPVMETVAIQGGVTGLTESDCPDGGLLVEFFSNIEKAKMQACMIKIGNEFVKHGPLLKYDSAGQPKQKENYNRGVKI